MNDELHVDKFHEKDNRLYRVMENQGKTDGITTSVESSGPLAKYTQNSKCGQYGARHDWPYQRGVWFWVTTDLVATGFNSSSP